MTWSKATLAIDPSAPTTLYAATFGGCVSAMLTETAVAADGTLQVLAITNVRLVPPESRGPPGGPTGLRGLGLAG